VEEVLNKQDGNMNFICAYCIACGVKFIQNHDLDTMQKEAVASCMESLR
jgi:hypothetical protein